MNKLLVLFAIATVISVSSWAVSMRAEDGVKNSQVSENKNRGKQLYALKRLDYLCLCPSI